MHRSILVAVGSVALSVAASACDLNGVCACSDAPHPAMSEPPIVNTGAPPSLSPTIVHVFDFDYSTDASPLAPIMDAVIHVGETVEWQWDSGFHTVTSVQGSAETFLSPAGSGLPPFSHTFTKTGVFTYYCEIHAFDNGDGTADGMVGTVTVLANQTPGDANGDGSVNSLDFDIFAANYGTTSGATFGQGDFDNNGAVNTLDFNLLSGAFGGPGSSPSLGSTVPEPSVLAALLAFPLVRRRR